MLLNFVYVNESQNDVVVQLEPWAIGLQVPSGDKLVVSYSSTVSENMIELVYVNSVFLTIFLDECDALKLVIGDVDVTSNYPLLKRL